jgi:hypothetical protein
MLLVIQTQDQENYGAHAWDGEGACPQRWKFKGGSCYKITNVPQSVSPDTIVGLVRSEIEQSGDYYRVDIVGYGVEADGWTSEFEKSQLEYDGEIVYPEPTIDYGDIKAVFDREYADWSATLDAHFYGETV